MKSLLDRFLDKVEPEPNSGCWLWNAATMGSGEAWKYGKMSNGRGRLVGAHRIAWELYRGPIPEGLFVCHACDVSLCVNPDHLFLGTPRDNTHDSVDKGRMGHGEGHEHSKLTDREVLHMRHLRRVAGDTYSILGDRFGVDPETARDAVTGRTWRHLPGGLS